MPVYGSATLSGKDLSTRAEHVRRQAADLAARMAAAARDSATIAQERALLRMLGVDGLDRESRPLAASTAERFGGTDGGRLGRGILLPFTVAMLEYELSPRETALDVAAGAIDLELEARLLERPERLAAATKSARALLDAALKRFDANRTATREMRDVLGSRPEPWLAVPIQRAEVRPAVAELRQAVDHGADVAEIRVPANWEYAETRRSAGLDIPGLFEARRNGKSGRHDVARGRLGRLASAGSFARSASAVLAEDEEAPIPAGSQRGLAELRRAADEAGAHRGRYVSLMTITSAFAAPEQAVVAALERVDFVEVDPMREIVEENLDPDRVLADHAFAHRLQARAGCRTVVGPGPLALGAEVALGVPSNTSARAGASLALQALGVELALADGLPAGQMILGCVPRWLIESGSTTMVPLQAYLRRLVFPGYKLVAIGAVPGVGTPLAAVVATLAGCDAAMVLERDNRPVSAVSFELTAAVAAAAAIRSTFGRGHLTDGAEELASQTLDEASRVLDRLASDGWQSILGPGHHDEGDGRVGQSAVVARIEGLQSGHRILDALL